MPARAYPVLAAGALAAIVAGLILQASDRPEAASIVWGATVLVLLVPLVGSVLVTLAHGRVGVDLIALIAMAGALALGEELAGAVIALMLAGGNALETAADRRARRELTALLERMPTVAHVRRGDQLEEVSVDAVAPGEVIVVRAGEIVPVDGIVVSQEAVVDESTLTGESLPVTYGRGGSVRSGVANAAAPFDLRAVRPAAQSAYAALVSLVRAAEADRAPFTRLADRYAALLLPVTLVIAAAAWAASGDAVRGLAVVVVATPCPLILAAPIALVSGVSRAARAGIVVKGAGVIERLGRARSVLLDKTGTLTLGTPRVARIEPVAGTTREDVLRFAASLDQLSAHVLAAALVRGARDEGLELAFPEDVREEPGQGIEGTVDHRHVTIGAAATPATDAREQGLARIAVTVDGAPAGTIVMADHIRDDAGQLVDELRAAGVRYIAMVTGDHAAVAEPVGSALGLDRVYADCTPEGKLEVVAGVRDRPGLAPVLMVGDGVNDAPALARADVGIAMGETGATASSEAADAIITINSIAAVAEAVRIGRRSLKIATQSVVVGMALSFVAMGFAAVGLLPPVAGALVQEGIDVAVILNALRALRA
ncbi:MAG: heavy metal translocating P-type ATPase [Baekduia sp.]